MNVEQTRKMLDLEQTEYSDEYVEEIIRQTESLAYLFIEAFKARKMLSVADENVYNVNADNNDERTL